MNKFVLEVLKPFRDKYDLSVEHNAGELFELADDARIADLTVRKLAKVVKKVEPPKKRSKKDA